MFCSDVIMTKTYKPNLLLPDSMGAYTESAKDQHRNSLATTDYMKAGSFGHQFFDWHLFQQDLFSTWPLLLYTT